MIEILIADDEELIRRGIVSILKNAIKSDVSYSEAENGLEALKICKKIYPQIIISDIRMPCCDGLKFIEKVKKIGYEPTFIIISGYSEFDYAKQAIKYGVKDYVLKPIHKKQFIGLVQSCVDEIIKKESAKHDEHITTQTNAKAIKAVRKKLLIDLLNCSDEKRIDKIDNLEKSIISPNTDNIALCCVVQYKIDKSSLDYIDFAIINILKEILAENNLLRNTIIEKYSDGQIVLVFEGCNAEIDLDLIAPTISKAFHYIFMYLKTDVFAGIGDIQFGPLCLYKSFHHACEAADYKLYQHGNRIQKYNKFDLNDNDYIHFETFLHSLDDLNTEKIICLFDRQIHKRPSAAAAYAIEKSYENLIETVGKQLKNYFLDTAKDIPESVPFYAFWNFVQLKKGIENYLEQVKELVNKSKKDDSNNKLIKNIISYVRIHFADDINLNSVSNYFSYTPSYISSLFKKHIGIGFNEFLTKTKMDMAKDMLENADIPINKLSELCGYSNSKYFAASFKKNFGVSPSAFRQKIEN